MVRTISSRKSKKTNLPSASKGQRGGDRASTNRPNTRNKGRRKLTPALVSPPSIRSTTKKSDAALKTKNKTKKKDAVSKKKEVVVEEKSEVQLLLEKEVDYNNIPSLPSIVCDDTNPPSSASKNLSVDMEAEGKQDEVPEEEKMSFESVLENITIDADVLMKLKNLPADPAPLPAPAPLAAATALVSMKPAPVPAPATPPKMKPAPVPAPAPYVAAPPPVAAMKPAAVPAFPAPAPYAAAPPPVAAMKPPAPVPAPALTDPFPPAEDEEAVAALLKNEKARRFLDENPGPDMKELILKIEDMLLDFRTSNSKARADDNCSRNCM